MEEHLCHEKESINDNSSQHRVSESRPKFKPVLVKKLLADESDDDSDDQDSSLVSSDNEFDDFDGGFQPLSEEACNTAVVDKISLVTKTDVKKDIVVNDVAAVATASIVGNIETIELPKVSDTSSYRSKEKDNKSVLNSYLKDSLKISEYIVKKSDEEKLLLDKPTTDVKRLSNNIIVNQDSHEHRQYSTTSLNKQYINETSDEKSLISSKMPIDQANSSKCPASQSTSIGSAAVIDTPMKHPQGTTRPNPCHSHRNIFQTPQNKIGSEFAKNSIQTPATIFSHWSQQHMAQTPMHSQISLRETTESRESIQTPATSITQSQSSSRYYTGESKNVRRPLAETMYSAPVHGSQLPRLQEIPNESQPNQFPSISRENCNIVKQESLQEKKPVYSSSHSTHEIKENRNPNTIDTIKNDITLNNQPKLSVSETRNSMNSHVESKPKLEYHNNTYMKTSRTVEKYDNYQVRESQNIHTPITNQAEQMQKIQCSIPQQTNLWNSRQNKIITVKDRQYLVLGVLGQGMSCEVVRVQDLSSSELRAIKCVNLSKMDKDSAQGCLQEICMLDKLKAPCIVHMYNFEIKQPWVHVVMEIGDTDLSRLLKSMLQEKKQIPLTMALYYWTEMLTAVKHIHENGVIHSDLKPANFLLVRGRLKLIDFGIASNINSDMTSVVKNCPIGTLNYISPEALMDVNTGSTDSPNHSNKFKISYKSDVWSLGCILYGLVYGVTPFNHIRQQWAKISAITDPKHKINFPLKIASEPVPLILIDVMRKCLQRDAKARPTVAELLEIPYLQNNISPVLLPNIPPNILIKIKNTLSEEEWKQLTEILHVKGKS